MKAGDKMPDGTVYAAISPDSGEELYVAGKDTSEPMQYDQAMKYVARLEAHGHDDWRLPTRAELDVLFHNRRQGALRDTFNESGSYPLGKYWTRDEHDRHARYAWQQSFEGGVREWSAMTSMASVRPVRTGPLVA